MLARPQLTTIPQQQIVLQGVGWETYQSLLKHLATDAGKSLTYTEPKTKKP